MKLYGAPFCLALCAVSAAAQRPNVVLIYADDLGKGMLSFYGQKQFSTPHIDRLFRQGVAFDNAYGCMLSAPARASLLTGYHDCRTDKWNVSPGGRFVTMDTSLVASREAWLDSADVQLPAGDDYLAQVFRHAGYTTAAVGKLEWGFTATRRQMTDRGWSHYYGYLDHVRCHGYYPPFLFADGQIELLEGNTRANCGKTFEPETDRAYADRWNSEGKAIYAPDLLIDRAVDFITAHRDEPFFLFYPTILPHGPVQVKAVDPRVADNPHLTPIEKEYASMVLLLDDQVGQLLATLEQANLMDRTVVVFTADNGHEIYYAQKGRVEKPFRNMERGTLFDDYTDKYYSTTSGDVFDGNAGMAGLKRSNLDGGVRVPLAFYMPTRWSQGGRRDDLVALYDLLPTFAELIGGRVGEKDGRSFAKVLDSGGLVSSDRTIFYSSYIGPAVVRADGWKLRYYAPKKVYELYNLRSDPRETTDLSSRYPELVVALRRELLAACGGAIERGICRN